MADRPTQTVVRVFASSPSDVGEEREALEEVVHGINREEERFHLMLFRWDGSVVPQVGPGPQDVIDGQTPDYDVYLGIMASRFGTPTGGHRSGTEKEYREALARWGEVGKPWILFYFRDNPKISSNPEDAEQYLAVCKFRRELESSGIVGSYTTPRGESRGFFEQVGPHLRGILKRIPPLDAPAGGRAERKAGPKAPALSQAYRTWLRSQWDEVELLGLKLKKGRAFTLEHVYVPPTTPHGERGGEDDPAAARRRLELERQKPQLLLDALNERSVYVPGAPGSGKSTFCRWVAWLGCCSAMPDQPVAPPEGFAESFPAQLEGRLPLLVRLREFWPYLPETPDCRRLTREQLEQALERWLANLKPGGLTWPDVASHLEQGSALLLIDGVDEVPLSRGEEARPCYPRAMLLAGLTDAVPAWVERGNRVLLTSRPYGVDDADVRKLQLPTAPIDELAPEAQALLRQKWFRVLEDDPAAAAATADEMGGHLAAREDLEPLTGNPMLLTAMCIIYGEGKRLPQDKADLYDRIVDNVLHNRYGDPGTIAAVRNRLCVVAHGMHTGQGLDEKRTTPQAEATYAEIDLMLQAYRDRSSHTEPGFEGALAAREDLLGRTGILLPRGDKRAAFYHLSFQEFLAAQRIVDLEEGRLDDLYGHHAGTAEWRITLAFAFDSRLTRSVSPEHGIRLAERLIELAAPPEALGLQLAVADCLEILLGRGIRLSAEYEEKFRRICLSAIEREVPLRARRDLALMLGRLGDERLPQDPRDPAGYVEIPAGIYRLGEKKRKHRIEQPFRIARYPVTNAWFGLFLEDGGYAKREWWSERGWAWRTEAEANAPALWHHARWNAPTLPVVGVSYWEAEAFCAWVGGRLPTAEEWEAAARGPEGFEYPWGDEWVDGICNSREADVGATTPVGIFPRSRSKVFGLEDIAGNVGEWTTSSPGSDWRVLRGGSWYNTRNLARAACRFVDHPYDRFSFIGFRVLCSSPISGGL